jgi:GPI mannosyltransferase 3
VLVVLGLAVVGAIRQRVAALFATVAFLTHSLIAHKEYRFIYPVMVVIALLASQGLARVYARFSARNRVSQAMAMGMAVLVWSAISGWRALRFATPGSNGRDSMWRLNSDSLMGMAAIGADEGVCGVGLVDVSWGGTGGYSYLHRNVPVYLIVEPWMLLPTTPAFNTALVPIELSSAIPGYTVEKCWQTACVVKRQGTCIDTGAEKINDALARVGA